MKKEDLDIVNNNYNDYKLVNISFINNFVYIHWLKNIIK